MSLEYPWNIPGMSLECPWNIPGMSLEYPWNIPGISLECPWNVPGMSLDRQGRDQAMIYPRRAREKLQCWGQEGLGVTAVPVLSSVPSAVPLTLECPGGSDAWQDVTADGSSRLCQGQRNPCNTWPCPENSVCAPDGPGFSQCLCDNPFHGYKCLREGTFPMLLFGGILGTATVSLSLLLWGTQRRKAKTP
uniref:EGF-like domain-containing protein n=1 Tax=Cyanistes caeruleus TaxID=156563 RepID=A0A8C0VR77_CYACU